jgi:hypothetical protein
MIANFKKVKEVKFLNNDKTFKSVYVDRFNSIFKGIYVVATEECIKNKAKFIAIRSTERFGSLNSIDVISIDIQADSNLSKHEKEVIKLLNCTLTDKDVKELQRYGCIETR